MSTIAVGFPHPRLALSAVGGTSVVSVVEYKSLVIGSRCSVCWVGLQHVEEQLVDEEFEIV
jgi:hypothetical protein